MFCRGNWVDFSLAAINASLTLPVIDDASFPCELDLYEVAATITNNVMQKWPKVLNPTSLSSLYRLFF